MKQLSYLISIPGVMCLLTPAYAAEIWATGVSATEGWIDYEKQDAKGDGDDNLCWAASSANIIDFWQQHYIVPEGTPTGAAIWERFKTAGTTDTGGNFVFAIQWWLGGDYEGTTLDDNVYGDNLTPEEVLTHANNRAIARHSSTDVSAIKTDLDTFGGYYWSTIPQTYDGTPYVNSRQKHLFNFVWFARQDVQPVPTNGSYDAPALLAVAYHNDDRYGRCGGKHSKHGIGLSRRTDARAGAGRAAFSGYCGYESYIGTCHHTLGD